MANRMHRMERMLVPRNVCIVQKVGWEGFDSFRLQAFMHTVDCHLNCRWIVTLIARGYMDEFGNGNRRVQSANCGILS
jgi:hypothetical protein